MPQRGAPRHGGQAVCSSGPGYAEPSGTHGEGGDLTLIYIGTDIGGRSELFRKLETALAARPVVVNSFLDLRGSDMTTLPQLYVRDSMNIEHSQIAELAPGTRIVGSLYATGSKLTHLPEDLTVGCNPYDPANGSLMIEGLPIADLPESVTVGGLIRAAGSHLTWEGIPQALWPQVRGLGMRSGPEA